MIFDGAAIRNVRHDSRTHARRAPLPAVRPCGHQGFSDFGHCPGMMAVMARLNSLD
jgi:hypothetical protein